MHFLLEPLSKVSCLRKGLSDHWRAVMEARSRTFMSVSCGRRVASVQKASGAL
jgi:hypothetical protein